MKNQLLLALAISACVRPLAPLSPRPHLLRVATYNIAGGQVLKRQTRRQALRSYLQTRDFAIVGLQEAAPMALMDGAMPAHMNRSGNTSNVVLYDSRLFRAVTSGDITLGENDDGFGKRTFHWVRLRDASRRELVAYSTHWCLPARSTADRCNGKRLVAYARTLIDHARAQNTAIIIFGDLNLFDGFDDSPALATLTRHFTDAFRTLNPTDSGHTFRGNAFGPPGRIDFVLTFKMIVETAKRDTGVSAIGSDHWPVIIEVAQR